MKGIATAIGIIVGFLASTVTIIGYMENFLSGPSIDGYWIGDPGADPVSKKALKKSCVHLKQQTKLRNGGRVGVFGNVYYYSGLEVVGSPTRHQNLVGSFDGAELGFRYVARSTEEDFSAKGEGILTLTSDGLLEGVWSGSNVWSGTNEIDDKYVLAPSEENHGTWILQNASPNAHEFGTWKLTQISKPCPT